MNRSIHSYLKELCFNVFKEIISAKEGDNDYRMSILLDLDKENFENLIISSPYTKYKFYNLFNIISSTPFSKNLISFNINLFNNQKEAKVDFEYPLYDMLYPMVSNNIFGIEFEDYEIKLLKQIYENYIINVINTRFKDPIKIPTNSSSYPIFYTLISVKIIIKKLYLQKYCIRDNDKLHFSIDRYENQISNLNKTISKYTIEEQKIDQYAYNQELRIRKESEPNWFLLKDNEMGKNKQQVSVIKDYDNRQIFDDFGNFLGSYNIKQYTNAINKFNTDILIQERKDNYQIWKNDQEWKKIFDLQNIILKILKTDSGALWYDTRIKKYCFRSKLNGSINKVDSSELGDLLTRALKEKIRPFVNFNYNLDYAMEIVLVSKLKGINNKKLTLNEKSNDIIKILLFENEIITIDDDVFDVNNQNEFFKNDSDLLYARNHFVSNKYLKKRYQQVLYGNEQTFIEKFIYHLVKENQELSNYIMNWLAYYFQNLQKSKTALVLLGEREVTKDIFWNIIIKEIFSKQYCITIDDKECDSTLVSDIAKDKLFFHIGDIDTADTKFDDETLALIIKNLLIRPSVTTDANKEIDIHGQILITAANPAPYLKKVLSKCTVVEVNNIDTIMEKLDVEDEGEFEDAIYSDLDDFTNKLANYNIVSENAESRIDTEARETLKGNKFSNIDKDAIEQNIDDFIKAIKDKDINYFEKVEGIKDKEGNDICKQLKYAFNKGYFIGQDLYLYYNAINELPFKTNKALMDKLKTKDEMFKQEVKTLKILTKDGEEKELFKSYTTPKETGGKDLYKIDDYIQAKDINIPDGATVTTSQPKSKIKKFTFSSEDEEEKCIQRTKKYSDKKKKEKEQK